MSHAPTESARERLAARARRMAVIRRRVLVATLATFALAWGVIAYSGSMGAATTTASTQTATSSSSDDAASSSSGAAASSSSSSDDDSASSSGAVTTAQS